MLVALEGTVSLYVPLFLSLINGARRICDYSEAPVANARGSERMRYRTASVRESAWACWPTKGHEDAEL
jgi:hypothetical protein